MTNTTFAVGETVAFTSRLNWYYFKVSVRLWACVKWLAEGAKGRLIRPVCLLLHNVWWPFLAMTSVFIQMKEGFTDWDSILTVCLRWKREANGFWHVVDMAECTAGLNAWMLPSKSSNRKHPQSSKHLFNMQLLRNWMTLVKCIQIKMKVINK